MLKQEAKALVDSIVEIALSEPQVVNAPFQQTTVVAVCKFLRPYIEESVRERAPRKARSVADRRLKRWLISLEFWRGKNLDEHVAESEGRRVDYVNNSVLAMGGEIVEGLHGAAELVAEFARAIGAPEESFGAAPMQVAFDNLRPTLSRQGGYGTMKRKSLCENWWLRVDVQHESIIADPEPERQGLRRVVNP